MTIIAFISSLRFGRFINQSSDSSPTEKKRYSVTKVCDLKRQHHRRPEIQKMPKPAKAFENHDEWWFQTESFLDPSEARNYMLLAATTARGMHT